MSQLKEFTTAAKRTEKQAQEAPEDITTFKMDGRELNIYKPDEGQYAMLMASVGRGASDMDRISGVINFFVKIMDEKSAGYIESRLLDRSDPFGIDDVEDIVQWLNEEWSGKVTPPPSGSTVSPLSAGLNLTQPTLLST